MKGFPDLPPIWFAGFAAGAWGLSRTLPLIRFDNPVTDLIGALMILGGIGLALWSLYWFRRRRTTFEPHHTPTALIVEGPFRLSRNPIYVGLVAILAGYALRLGTLTPLLLVPVFWWVLHRRFALPEEAGLRAAFGAEAEAYIAATRRWL
ncbi:methyltransferase family protein [Pontivivens ytuae]|uniref:Isoprenylcysteine carboxylmethyltransferase family protein n=1 Tax=Pontivivens ytuae TaxID=2789856 RepID=A0A7S9QCX8_9RHOB|nr:isoprenylcysteine carboxylmethyltransferase family protein [Pontivivens ytuae]QPH54693.1 isoprenylcysteine carboxylmethyltransferase family protein [Pontivivens ytuae]